MVFSSPEFLFLFLPAILLLYYLLGDAFKNGLLLLASLFFYTWGEGHLILLMVCSIAINYLLGLGIGHSQRTLLRKSYLALAVLINLGLLAYFKYSNFFLDNMMAVGWMELVEYKEVILPIGISFFTFQSLSYLVDVYRNTTQAQDNPFRLGLYIALFPQLIAGPIVRYHDVANQINHRTHTLSKFSEGVVRFVRGLAKKLIIANPMAVLADQAFGTPAGDLAPLAAWVGIICYALQIYFDFSGYSDMAIGLGKMFGFRFLENFRWPYRATSIQDFWRRWHISLSTWFRDYLYIPLGGNRKGVARTYLHLVLVFMATGIWHGANWTFLIWGLYHGTFLIIERLGWRKVLDRLPTVVGHLYTLLVVLVGWVFFRAESLPEAASYLSSMMGLSGGVDLGLFTELTPYHGFILALGLLFSFNLRQLLRGWMVRLQRQAKPTTAQTLAWAYGAQRTVVMAVLLLWAMSELAQNSYNPFIYFRF